MLYINMCKIEPDIFICSTSIYLSGTRDGKAKKDKIFLRALRLVGTVSLEEAEPPGFQQKD